MEAFAGGPADIIYCHCAKSVRALMAAKILLMAQVDVRALESGYDVLREAGFPVVEPKAGG